MSAYVCTCLTVYDNILLNQTISDYIWLYLTISFYIFLYLSIYDYIGLYLTKSHYIWLYITITDCILLYLADYSKFQTFRWMNESMNESILGDVKEFLLLKIKYRKGCRQWQWARKILVTKSDKAWTCKQSDCIYSIAHCTECQVKYKTLANFL